MSDRSRLMQIISDQLSLQNTVDQDQNTLKLINLSIQSIPPEAIELVKETVERLSLHNNLLTNLPQYFNRLSRVRYLDLHDNRFTVFPDILTKMDVLEILDISFNQLIELPNDIGNLKNLKVLSIKNNKFEIIPNQVLHMKNLQILEIENNPFKQSIQAFFDNIQYKQHSQEWLQEIKTFLYTNINAKPKSYHNETENDHQSLPQAEKHLERSRSTSESYVSSRAAKRMGFIIKRPNPDLSNDVIKEDIGLNETRRNRSFSTSSTMTNSNNNLELPPSSSSTSSSTNVSPSLNTELTSSSNRSNDYFKRLSTLPEENRQDDIVIPTFKIVEISRKILFAINEVITTLKKLNQFCSSKQTISDIVSTLFASKFEIDRLVESLERIENSNSRGIVSIDDVLKSVISTIHVFKKLIVYLSSNYENYVKQTDVSFIRMFFMTLFLSYTEVFNAYKIISPNTFIQPPVTSNNVALKKEARSQLPPLRIPENFSSTSSVTSSTITQQQLSEYREIDDKLYESLSNALFISNQVYSDLNNSISASALSNAKSSALSQSEEFNPTVISKIRELTSTCVVSMELNKKLKLKLKDESSLQQNSTLIPEKKKFYDDINSFLKSIISILGLTKSIMNESSILNEVRPSLSNLTKATKDVTIMLEVSSYRLINDQLSSNTAPQSVTSMVPPSALPTPMLTSIPSVMSIPQMNTNYINMNQNNSLPIQTPTASNNLPTLTPSLHSSNLTNSAMNTPSILTNNNPFEMSLVNDLQHHEQ